MRSPYARTHDGLGFVEYVELEPPGPHVRSYWKRVIGLNRAYALRDALNVFIAEHERSDEDQRGPDE